ERRGQRDGGVERRARRNDPVDQPERERFVRLHVTAGPHELLGAGRPDDPGGALGPARAGHDAELDLREPGSRAVTGDAPVAREGAGSSPRGGANPWMGGITGGGIAPGGANAGGNGAVRGGATPGWGNSAPSAPAANARSPPVTTTAFRDGSSASSVAAASIA